MISIPTPEMAKVKRDNPKLLAAATIEGVAVVKTYRQDKLEMYDRMRRFIEHVRRLSKKDVKSLLVRIQQQPEVRQLKNK